MAKNLFLDPILAHLAHIRAANFCSKIWLRQSLDIMISYHHVQYQKKLMIQYWENVMTDGRTDSQAVQPFHVKPYTRKKFYFSSFIFLWIHFCLSQQYFTTLFRNKWHSFLQKPKLVNIWWNFEKLPDTWDFEINLFVANAPTFYLLKTLWNVPYGMGTLTRNGSLLTTQICGLDVECILTYILWILFLRFWAILLSAAYLRVAIVLTLPIINRSPSFLEPHSLPITKDT